MKEEMIRKSDLFDTMLRLAKEDSELFFSKKEDYRLVVCVACAQSNYHKQFEKNGFDYVLCDNCSTLFVNPRPSMQQFKEFYMHGASTKFYAEQFFPPVAEERRAVIFRPRAEFVAPLMEKNRLEIVGDVGAGFGLFCEELKHLSPKVTVIAIEPEHTMAEICRTKGIRVVEKMLEDIEPKESQFDLLTAFELMEHLHTPSVFLKKIWDLLRPGGYFLFTTLNIEGFDLQILWDSSKSITPPHHINFLNPRSTAIMLEQHGFEDIDVVTPGKLDIDIVEGMYRKGLYNPNRFWKLFFDRETGEVKQTLQNFLSEHRLSSHMRVLARKPIHD